MTLVVLSVVAATILGFAFRGSLARLGQPATRRNGLLAFGVLSLCTVFIAQRPNVWAGWLGAGAVALVVYARLNRGRPGLALMAAGMLLNVVVIVANASMPVSLDAAERAGVTASRLDAAGDPLREPLVDGTTLPWIAQTVPLALPVLPDVASPGDLLVAAGAAVFVFTGLTGRGRPRPEPPRSRKGKGGRKRKRTAEAQPGPDAPAATGTVFDAPRTAAGAASAGQVLVAAAGSGSHASPAPTRAGDADTVPVPAGRADAEPFGPRGIGAGQPPLGRSGQDTVVMPLPAVPDPVTPPEFGPGHAGLPQSAEATAVVGVPTAASAEATAVVGVPTAASAATIPTERPARPVTAPSTHQPAVEAPVATAVSPAPAGTEPAQPAGAASPDPDPDPQGRRAQGRDKPGRSAKRSAAAQRTAAGGDHPASAGGGGRRVAGRPPPSTHGSHAADETGPEATKRAAQRDRRKQRRSRAGESKSSVDVAPSADVAGRTPGADSAERPHDAPPAPSEHRDQPVGRPPAAWDI